MSFYATLSPCYKEEGVLLSALSFKKTKTKVMITELRKEKKKATILNSLSEKIQQLKDINHIMAHNLRGAAGNIKMVAEILMERKITELNADTDPTSLFPLDEAIRYIHESSTSLLNTLNILMEATDIDLIEDQKRDVCDLEALIGRITCQLGGIIARKQAVIELDLGVTHIEYPLSYLESMMYNFINNALKYSRDDLPVKIRVATYNFDGKIILAVKDNGIGIDLETYGDKIFQLNQVFHTGYDSKGVGLYLTKMQVESLGGVISVKSKVNEGSEFFVVF
jgi:signal transduction histidine kinase